ncbi:ATP-dependent RecD-like DNA helicase [soil metagenome]
MAKPSGTASDGTLAGIIDRIVFHNLDNGYCVLRVQAKGHAEPITVVGNVPKAVAGEQITATGEWIQDRNFGPQFKANELKTLPPHSKEGIVRYLGSGFVKGIGPVYAQKIVDAFGEKTLDIIDAAPARLREVRGIGPKRIDIIRSSWQEQKHIHRIMAFLQSHGIGPGRAVRIYKMYGDTAIEQVRANPYRLSEDIWGVGFKTADELAQKLGLPADAPQRADAAVRHCLKDASGGAGHVALPTDILLEATTQLTGLNSDKIRDAITRLTDSTEIVVEADLVYLAALFNAEVEVARLMTILNDGPHPLPKSDIDKALVWVESRMTITLSKSQQEAIRKAMTSKVMVLTGGPGTGKTTIVKAILEIMRVKGVNVLLAAPTGRAAKRLSESTGREAKTIHRLLEFDPQSGGFLKGKGASKLDCDMLVIDETSMVDLPLMFAVLKAVPPHAALLLVGDVDQLPSVGPGSVLRDFIDSQSIPVARLREVHRQAEASYIVRAAHAVNQGIEPESAPTATGDFFVIEADEPAQLIEKVLMMAKDRIPARFGLDPIKDVQVLSPMNKSELGVHNLNTVLQAALNPPRDGERDFQRFGTSFRNGDKVMQTRNNYTREVYNGDIGRIVALDHNEQVALIMFDDRPVEYEFNDMDELVLAYAATIHKSQGSEYAAVIIPVHTQHFVMLQRNLLYTAITRGRKLVVLVGSKKAMWIAVNKAETSERYGRLKERLKG